MTTYGFNFRATSGYVTDLAPDTYAIDDIYPVTRNGITFGWEGLVSDIIPLDRSTGVPARFAGLILENNFLQATWRVDLPAAGAWDIRAALGDVNSGQVVYVLFVDDTTTFATVDGTTGAADNYFDPTGAEHTGNAAWTSNNTKVTRTFGSTIFRIKIADDVSKHGFLAHVNITDVGGGPPPAGGGVGLYSPRGTTQPVARGWA